MSKDNISKDSISKDYISKDYISKVIISKVIISKVIISKVIISKVLISEVIICKVIICKVTVSVNIIISILTGNNVSCNWVFPWVTDKKSSWILIYFQARESIYTKMISIGRVLTKML
jgi:hypothetical protein